MEEIVVKIDVPSELNEEFRLALAKVIKQFVRRVQFSLADSILSKSELTDKQISELAGDLKGRVAKRHGL
ncbi:hypothetical protein HYT23_05700 [Candidatus Pacearchaeota archaeon]|nr:hypothetical protein [Candidatus Pacearchaeota archaeon]